MKLTFNNKDYDLTPEQEKAIGEVLDKVWPKDGDAYHFVEGTGHVSYERWENDLTFCRHHQEMGSIFRTKEEAEAYVAYRKAETIIRNDAKAAGRWEGGYWFGTLDYGVLSVEYLIEDYVSADIKFPTIESIEASQKNHPEAWKTYLEYER